MASGTRSMEAKVGALMLAGVGLLVGFMVLLGDWRCAETAALYVDFPGSGDLKTGAPVKISGVTVGRVAGVELWGGRLDPGHGNKLVMVRVKLNVLAGSFTSLRKGARFYITTLGALGEKYVEIDPGPPDEASLSPGDVVDGVEPMRLELIGADATSMLSSMSAILKENREDIRDLIKKTRDLAGHLDETLSENRIAIRETIAKANATMDSLARSGKAVETALGDGGEARRLIASASSLAQKMDRDLGPAMAASPRIAKSLEKTLGDAGEALAEARQMLKETREELKVTMANLRAVSQAVRDGKGSIGALLADREMYDDLVEMLKDLKRHPWKMLLKE